jgi:hypothetical protein
MTCGYVNGTRLLVMWYNFFALAADYHLQVKYKTIFHDVFREERDGMADICWEQWES